VTVQSVSAGSAAAGAGLARGDVITAVGGKPVTTAAQLRAAIDAAQPGQTVELRVYRNGTTRTLKAKLGTRP
jgi:putative serine protease PepD